MPAGRPKRTSNVGRPHRYVKKDHWPEAVKGQRPKFNPDLPVKPRKLKNIWSYPPDRMFANCKDAYADDDPRTLQS